MINIYLITNMVNKKVFFTSEVEAARVYDKKAFELFGNNAKLNFKVVT